MTHGDISIYLDYVPERAERDTAQPFIVFSIVARSEGVADGLLAAHVLLLHSYELARCDVERRQRLSNKNICRKRPLAERQSTAWLCSSETISGVVCRRSVHKWVCWSAPPTLILIVAAVLANCDFV